MQDSEVIRILLEAGAAINQRDNTGRTPLHWVALNGNGVSGTVSAHILIENGADFEIQDAFGKTAFDCATERGEFAVDITILLQHAMERPKKRQRT